MKWVKIKDRTDNEYLLNLDTIQVIEVKPRKRVDPGSSTVFIEYQMNIFLPNEDNFRVIWMDAKTYAYIESQMGL